MSNISDLADEIGKEREEFIERIMKETKVSYKDASNTFWLLKVAALELQITDLKERLFPFEKKN